MSNFSILVFAGYSGAGKSTVSKSISEMFRFDLLVHQEVVHGIAISKGYERARHWLADVGVDNFIEESENEMIRRIKLMEGVRGVVLDVAYGEKMISKLRGEFPDSNLITIAVLNEPKVRGERIAGRMNASSEEGRQEMQFRDQFLLEAGVDKVIEKADIEIYNSGRLEDTLVRLTKQLEDSGITLL